MSGRRSHGVEELLDVLDGLVWLEAGSEVVDLADAAGGADSLSEEQRLVCGDGAVIDLASA